MFLLRAAALLLILLESHEAVRRGHRGREPAAVSGRGRWYAAGRMLCKWKGSIKGESAKILIRCESMDVKSAPNVCEYLSKPSSCPGFFSNPKAYWRQVNRVIERLEDKLCRDEHTLIKAKMCKHAPPEAHFHLDVASVSKGWHKEQANSTRACTGHTQHQKTAEKLCSSAWASVCTFFMTMLQSEGDC